MTTHREMIKKFGFWHQSLILIEEMSELTKELIKSKRRNEIEQRIASEELIEELVDVEIVLEQLKETIIEREDRKKIYLKYREMKLNRIKKLLEE
ncbi:MAG: hypothetical protein PHQ98_00250 [Candidatus ainarchaeum sp.]|nr:hypothetical protein [Candidatus ainarchaeum sp.]